MSTQTNINIEPLSTKERKDSKEVYLHALENDWETLEGNNDKQSWERNFRYWIKNDFVILLLKIDQEIQGYIAGDSSRILHLWIHPTYRKQGLSIDLIDQFLRLQANKANYSFTLKALKSNIGFFKNLDCILKNEFDDFAIFTLNRYG